MRKLFFLFALLLLISPVVHAAETRGLREVIDREPDAVMRALRG